MQREIIKIKPDFYTLPIIKKVAAYVRVSSGKGAMLHSLSAQISYYSELIQKNPQWEYAGVYVDEAKTGTKDNRQEFQRLISDCKQGKIDMIITKSISRFARNTLTVLETVRELKNLGIDVYFEEENIYTLDSKGELLITIMSSLAQEESRSISENVTWGQRKRFADGKVSLPYKQFLGYKKGEDGLPKIVDEQAAVVRRIYNLFIGGKTAGMIASLLTREAIPTPSGKAKWQTSTVLSILQNEKYRGDARLQKKFTIDFLTKKMKVNEGEVPQYYVENSHPAIIQPEEFELVQAEIAQRKRLGKQYSGHSILSARLVCADCGAFFGPKVWHSNSKYRTTIWRCNAKFDGEEKCNTPHLNEADVKERFLAMCNGLVKNKDTLLEDCRIIQEKLTDCTEIDMQIETLLQDIEVISELTRSCVDENSRCTQNQGEYLARYNSYVELYEKARTKLLALQKIKQQREQKADEIGGFMFALHENEQPLTEFDDYLWAATMDTVTVYSNDKLVFNLKNGISVEG